MQLIFQVTDKSLHNGGAESLLNWTANIGYCIPANLLSIINIPAQTVRGREPLLLYPGWQISLSSLDRLIFDGVTELYCKTK